MNLRDLKIYVGESIIYKDDSLRITDVTREGAYLMRKKDGVTARISLEKFNSMILAKNFNAQKGDLL